MYKDSSLSPKERAVDLLKKMTVDEKIDQMVFSNDKLNTVGYKKLQEGAGFEALCGCFEAPIDDKIANTAIGYCIEKTRLGIPMFLTFEGLHGLYHPKGTVFPQCLGLGGSFDRELIYQMADIIGFEARAVGIRQIFAPNIDIPRDPRWGRMQEAYGEDPYLVGEMGASYIKGIQNNNVAATAKHYIAYGVPENGINLSPAHVGEREVREVMLEPFIKAIQAGVMSIMPSYNEVDGDPLHGSKKWLKDVLRDELGFKGTVISDWGGTTMLHSFQRATKDAFESGKRTLNAGVDIEAPLAVCFGEEFRNAVKNGEIDIKLIDEAVLRILELKFKIGMFDDPYAKPQMIAQMNNKKAKDLSLKMDEESILLLKNDGMLPLNENKVGKVAVIGNNAKYSHLGNYIGYTDQCIDFYTGMVNRLGTENVLYATGCNHISTTDEMLNEAVEQAKKADTVFLVLGDSTNDGGGIGGGGIGGGDFKNAEITCGEGYDTHDLNLTPSQQRLFDEIIKLNKPTLLVFYAGRSYAIEDQVKKINAFMYCWGGGEQNGNAFANLIFGDKSPSAKLSVSLPKSVGHLPCYYNYKPTARGAYYKRHGSLEHPGRDYVLSTPNAWLPFGFGLSYTTLQYSNLTAQKLSGNQFRVSVEIKNVGDYDIKESVLLFISAAYCPTPPFVKKLRKFDKVEIKKGESKTVEFTLTPEDFYYVDDNMNYVVNKAKHTIIVEDLTCDIIVD